MACRTVDKWAVDADGCSLKVMISGAGGVVAPKGFVL